MRYPDVLDASRVGTYPAEAKAGGGFVWDAVLEYRVWCHPERGAPDERDGNDYFRAFATHAEALAFSQGTRGAEEPLALVLQREYIDEPQPGQYVHIKEERITEWPVEFLSRPKRRPNTIPDAEPSPRHSARAGDVKDIETEFLTNRPDRRIALCRARRVRPPGKPCPPR